MNTPLRAAEVRAQVNLIQEVMREVMQGPARDEKGREIPGVHYGLVPGCGDKPTLLQPGAHKLLMTFRLVADPEMTLVQMERGHREVRCKVKIYSQGGVLLGAGVGTCSTMEGKYRFRTGPVEFTDKPVPREYWDLRSSNPAKAKAMLGEGMIPKKNDAGAWVCARQGEKVEHDNPADYYNTVEKMAYKRALVSATLTVTAASDIFTQDIEDMPEVMPQQTAPPATASVQHQEPKQDKGSAVLDKMKKNGNGNGHKPDPSASSEGSPPSSQDSTTSDGSGPVLTADNVNQQFCLCESTAELSHVMNQWQAEKHLHTAEDQEKVSKSFNDNKKRIGKR
jgi:hypothetical protein